MTIGIGDGFGGVAGGVGIDCVLLSGVADPWLVRVDDGWVAACCCCFCVLDLRLVGVLRLEVWATVTDESAKVTTSKRANREKACVEVFIVAASHVLIDNTGVFIRKSSELLIRKLIVIGEIL